MDNMDALSAETAELLRARKWTLSTAESCTGGLIGHRVTRISGSSEYFRGGIIAYANEIKEKLLGVSHQSLVEYGAVSEAVAEEMAQGVRDATGTDVGLSITGIMGPTGGTPEKPVGLVFVGVSLMKRCLSERFENKGTRDELQWKSSGAALRLLNKILKTEGVYHGQ
jgi:PncC family amidohydrolase